MGFQTVDSPAMGLNNVPAAGQALAGKVDAIFVPNDTTVYAVFESLVKIDAGRQDPAVHWPNGAACSAAPSRPSDSISCSMGKVTALMVDQVLKGAKAGDLDVIDMTK